MKFYTRNCFRRYFRVISGMLIYLFNDHYSSLPVPVLCGSVKFYHSDKIFVVCQMWSLLLNVARKIKLCGQNNVVFSATIANEISQKIHKRYLCENYLLLQS